MAGNNRRQDDEAPLVWLGQRNSKDVLESGRNPEFVIPDGILRWKSQVKVSWTQRTQMRPRRQNGPVRTYQKDAGIGDGALVERRTKRKVNRADCIRNN